VVGLDTNLFVRVLVGDDAEQTKKAERAFLRHAQGDGVFVSLVVLAEIAWVLSTGYDLDRATIHGLLLRLLRTRGVKTEDFELVEAALEAYRTGKADLPDYLILAKARSRGAARLLTFDKKLAAARWVSLL
jgi:predicted nucleic-acid-binding protein